MKKITLFFVAMLAMAQMNAATPETAANAVAANAEAAAAPAAGDDDTEPAYQHPFKNNDESTKHWTIVTNGFYVGLGVKHSWDAINNSFEVGLLNAVGVNYNSLHGQNISLGAGIHHRSYSMKRPGMLVRDDVANAVVLSTYPSIDADKIKNRSSNLNMWSVQFPLMFSQKIVKKLDITVAGILNWNTYARVDNHYRQEDGYGALCYGYMPWTWLSLSTSYDVRYSKLWADLKRFSSVFRLDQKEVVAAQMNLKGVQAAVSMLHQHLHDFTNVHAGAADPLDRWTPAVSLAYTFNPSSSQSELTLRAWYKKIFRAPTLNDLYYTQVGNRDLQPEYTKQWNIGMEYHWNNRQWALNVQADAYQNKIENRIVCLPLKGTYTWTMMNYGYTFCQGLNATASGRYQLRDWQLSLLGTLTWQRDVNRTDPNDEDTYDKPICYSPRLSHTITAIAAWRQLSLTVSHMYVGERMWSYADPEDILKPYHNIDAKLSYSTTIGKTSVGACLEIIDLLDEQYEHIPRYPMPGRNYKLTLTFGI